MSKNQEKCCNCVIAICVIFVSWINGVIFGVCINLVDLIQNYDNFDDDINYGFSNGVWCCGGN